MAQAQKVRLPDEERRILETWGVIPTPTVPKIDVITEQVKARKWVLTIDLNDQGHTVARVFAEGERHEADGEHEGLAVVKAFCAALVATEPAQGALPLFGEDGEAEAEAIEADGKPFGFFAGGDGDAYPDPPAESFDRAHDDLYLGDDHTAAEPDDDDPAVDRDPNDGSTTEQQAATVLDMSEREYSIYRKHAVEMQEAERQGTAKPLEKLLDRDAELTRRLHSPALRERNREEYRAELRAVQEEIGRRQQGLGSDLFDENGGDELARKRRMLDVLQAAGEDVALQDGAFIEASTGVALDVEYVEQAYDQAVADQSARELRPADLVV